MIIYISKSVFFVFFGGELSPFGQNTYSVENSLFQKKKNNNNRIFSFFSKTLPIIGKKSITSPCLLQVVQASSQDIKGF
jgi:hypothetical protein